MYESLMVMDSCLAIKASKHVTNKKTTSYLWKYVLKDYGFEKGFYFENLGFCKD